MATESILSRTKGMSTKTDYTFEKYKGCPKSSFSGQHYPFKYKEKAGEPEEKMKAKRHKISDIRHSKFGI